MFRDLRQLVALGMALLPLTACSQSPYWTRTLPPLKHGGTLHYSTEQELARVCGYDGVVRFLSRDQTLIACTVRLETLGTYFIHAGPLYNLCAARHEDAHGAGWTHPDIFPFEQDCGPAGLDSRPPTR